MANFDDEAEIIFDEMFERARKISNKIQDIINKDETPQLALVMALKMLEEGYRHQIPLWNEIKVMVDQMEIEPKYKKGNVCHSK